MECRQLPEIVVSSNSRQLAEEWVRKMTDGVDSDSGDETPLFASLEPRPPRLGLGAKYLPHTQSISTLGPLDKRLRAIKTAGKRWEERELPSRLGGLPSSNASKTAQLHAEEEKEEEEEVKGSSISSQRRHQKRISPADMFEKNRGSQRRGVKRKK